MPDGAPLTTEDLLALLAQAPTFRTTNEVDTEGNPVVRGPSVGDALTKAQTIGAAAPSIATALEGRSAYREPTIRARTTAEAVNDAVRAAYGWAADTLPGRLTDALGFTNLAGGARDEPAPAVLAGTVELPSVGEALAGARLEGRRLGSLARTIRPTAEAGVYALRDPTVARVADLYRIGGSLPSTSNWAGSGSDELLAAFGGDQEAALRWARMWGATSPKTSVPVNTRESVSALLHTLENPGVPFTETLLQTLPEGKITNAPSKFANLNAAVEGRVLSPDTKAEAMAGFMAGDPRIPIDVHALYGLGSTATKFDPEISALRTLMTNAEGLPARGGLTNPEIYRRYEGALRGTLEELVPDQTVNQTFAQFWEGARAHKGLKPQGGPIDILRKKGLLEMGAMLDPDRLRAALRQQGWTAGAIAGLLASVGTASSTATAEPSE